MIKKNNGAGWGEGLEVTRLTYRFALNHSHKAREGTVCGSRDFS